MLRVIHSIPDSCVECGAENLSGYKALLREEGNTVLCNQCGIIMVLPEEEDDVELAEDERAALSAEQADFEVVASFSTCPHCKTVNEIQVAAGEEWCSGCGLDPNEEDVPVEQLASLWKEDSGIRNSMERGIMKPHSRMYQFLTTFCGPHCSYAADCPQSSKNFATCFREEVLEGEDPQLLQTVGDDVGKRSSKRQRRRDRKAAEERTRKEKGKAVLACAGSGWYERKYRNETEDPQRPAHTGSGSGT